MLPLKQEEAFACPSTREGYGFWHPKNLPFVDSGMQLYWVQWYYEDQNLSRNSLIVIQRETLFRTLTSTTPSPQNSPLPAHIISTPVGSEWLPGPGAVPCPPAPTPCTPNMVNWRIAADRGASYFSPQASPSGELIAPPGTLPPRRGLFSNHPLHRSPEAYPYPVPDPHLFPLSQSPPVPIYTTHTRFGSAWFPGPGAVPHISVVASGILNMDKCKIRGVGGDPCFSSPRTPAHESFTAPPSPSIDSSSGQRSTNHTPLCSPLVSPNEFTNSPPSPSTEASSAETRTTGSALSSLSRVTPDVARWGCMIVFNFSVLYRATENFSSDRLLGPVKLGETVHSGELSKRLRGWSSCTIAVKKMDLSPLKGLEQFKAEAEWLNQLVHPNILPLIGICQDPLCHVYPRLPCSVRDMLATKENRAAFPWMARVKVALDVVAGLAYLHAHDMIHRDVTLGNIHMDAKGSAHLAHFELFRKLDNSSTNLEDTAGTAGFVDPEYTYSNTVATASDIFSLGRVITCLLKGALNPLEANPAVDRVGECSFAADSLDEHAKWPQEQAQQMAHLITQCCQRNRSKRPIAQKVVQVLSLLLSEQGAFLESVPGGRAPTPSHSAPARLCKICNAAPCDTVFRPCSHSVACVTHAKEMLLRRVPCPMCGASIEWYEIGTFDSRHLQIPS